MAAPKDPTQIYFEANAKAGKPMPEGLTTGEQAAYQAIACLTARYRMGAIDADGAKREMAEIRKAFSYVDFDLKAWGIQQAFWRGCAESMKAYAENRTPETAETMYKVCSGLMRLSQNERQEIQEVRNETYYGRVHSSGNDPGPNGGRTETVDG